MDEAVIAKVIAERGSRARGLIEYLWGPGEANEHREPHIVAAWDTSFVRDPAEPELDHFERGLLAREMEAPLRLHNITPGKHVYHVPVAIEAEYGELSDEQWRQVAEEAAEALGFTETADRAAVPWVAMRHGPSKEGNDHIHFFAVLYRESGEKVTPWGDWEQWEKVRRAAEDRWGLRPTRTRGGGLPGITRAELERAEREHRPEPARTTLSRTVRAAAVAAHDEADFVRRVRNANLLIRPRWESGGQSEVVGYSVAMRPDALGEKPVWFGGGRLADDLTITEMRRRWSEPTTEQAADNVRAWRPAGWRAMPTGRQLTRARLRSEAWDVATAKTAEVRAALSQIDPADSATWAGVSGEAAGVLAALAGRVDIDHRGELRRAANALAGAAQADRGEAVDRRPAVAHPLAGVVRTAADALLAAYGGPYAVAALVIQMGRLVQAIQQANEAAGRAAQAQRSAQAAQEMLAYVRNTPRPPQPEASNEKGARQRDRWTLGDVTRPQTQQERNSDDRER